MSHPEANIRVNVDVTNPGQFFACCGLLELADRLWPGAEGWFEEGMFCVACAGTLKSLILSLVDASLQPIDADSKTSTRILLHHPFRKLQLLWWREDLSGNRDGRELKVWAGSMESFGIARAMQQVLRHDQFHTSDLFNEGMVVPDPDTPGNKKEPFYFDARRAPNAHSRDVGFSPNDLSLTTVAHPAVELLCLIGLQRGLPAKTSQPRVYDYFTWPIPLAPELVSAAVSGQLRFPESRGYRFENWYRTGQRKHKAFRSAVPLPQGVDQ